LKLKFAVLIFLVFALALRSDCFAASTVKLSMQTDRASYQADEIIIVYGRLTVNETAIPSKLVSAEVHDPTGNSIIARTVETATSGYFSFNFSLSTQSLSGIYTVYALCSYEGSPVSNTTAFQLESPSALVVTVSVNGTSFTVGANIGIEGSVTLNGVAAKQAYAAVEIRNPENSSISVRVAQTDLNGNYRVSLKMPEDAEMGDYTVYVSASYSGLNTIASAGFELAPQKLRADINGDGSVDIIDITLVALSWGTTPGHPRWDARCDLDGNNEINIIDITLVALDFGK